MHPMRFASVDVHHHRLVPIPGVHALPADVPQGLFETLSQLGRCMCEKSLFPFACPAFVWFFPPAQRRGQWFASPWGRPGEWDSRNHGSPQQTHDVNALAMLWDAEVCRVDDFESHFISGPRHMAQLLQNVIECFAVLRDQAFDVFQKKCPWAFGGQR